jgi:type I restriction enzyme, S subunit
MRLDELCSAIVDCEHKTAPHTPGGGYFAVGTPAMQGNLIAYEEAREISQSTFVDWTRRMTPQRGDLLLAREAPVGPIVRIPDSLNVAPGQRTVLMRPDERLTDSRFLFYAMASPQTQRRIQDLSMGSTVAHLNVADVRAFDLHVPPLPEQQAIVEVLWALDDKIAANARIADIGEDLMVGLVAGLVRDSTLTDVADLSREQVSAKELAEGVQWDHYSLPAFDAARLPVREAGSTILSSKFRLEGPSVLLSKLNPRIPRVWYVPSPAPNAVASTEFLILIPKAIPSAALWAVLASDASSSFLQERAAGTSGSHQRVGATDAQEMPMPSAGQFSPALLDHLGSLGDLVQAVRQESRTLAELRDTLLPALMEGTIRVKDAVATAEEVL